MDIIRLTDEQIARLSNAEAALYSAYLQSVKYDWRLWGRDKQQPPPGDWLIWLILAGRGWGKTATGAQWIRSQAMAQPGTRWAIVAPTFADARDTCVEGESGLLAVCAPGEINPKHWNRSLGELVFANGSRVKLFSSETPERLRGPQHHGAWCDELGAWIRDETWDQMQFGLRLGSHPRVVITTTPRPTPRIMRLAKRDAGVHITRGSTFENAANLAPSALAELKERYEGTRLGRQELYAEILEDVPGALWTREMLDAHRIAIQPAMKRIVVAVDPAVSHGEDSDLTGIIGVGRGSDDRGYVLADRSGRYSPQAWATQALRMYDELRADCIVAEANQGGDMIVAVIHSLRPGVRVQLVHARYGKRLRAEPVVAMYEQGRIAHVGSFLELEDQQCSWTVDVPWSPDRIDALVHGFTELFPDRSPLIFLGAA